MNISPVKTRVFKEGEDLLSFVLQYLPKLREQSIVVVTSKVVALAEGRVEQIDTEKQKAALIRRESEWQSRVLPKWWLTVRDGTVVVNAGIDDSNADGKTILLPKDSFLAAQDLRKKLRKHFGLKHLGVLITDSRISPLRAGVTGVALGYAGFRGVRDYRGKKDIFGRKLEVTQTNIADCLATASILMMGEGAEQTPLGIVDKAPVEFADRVDRRELSIPMKDDLYRDLFSKPRSRKI